MGDRVGGFVIAVLGAESTGKTTLAQALTTALGEQLKLRTTWVPEWLRTWCHQNGRTPQRHEQEAIARKQTDLIEVAAACHDVVVCDTTALMTAVYSQLLFDDPSLEPLAVQAHARVDLTLLTDLDLPWEADGLQRDGPHVRQPVDQALRQLLMSHQLPWGSVAGLGPQRLACAMRHAEPSVRRRFQQIS